MLYQIYFLTSDNQLQSTRYGNYPSDAEAFAALKWAIEGAAAAELWCGKRCVGLVTADEILSKQAMLAERQATRARHPTAS